MNAKLIIAGEERWLSNFHYEYFYPLKTPDIFPEIETFDMLVRPCDGPDGPFRYQLAGGLFNLSFASTEQDEFFWEWLMLGTMKEGRFELYKGDDEHFMKIEFWDCYCVGFHESMTLGSSPMQISLRLSPAITRNRKVVKHEKSWKVSDLNGDSKAPMAATSTEIEKVKLLVKKLEGPFSADGKKVEELIMGNSYLFKATQYNEGEGDKLNNTFWSVEVDNNGKQKQLSKADAYEQGGVICYKYTPETAETIRIYAWCQEASKGVSIEAPVVTFPFCVDKFRMPGLNNEGTDMAEDLAYGKGLKTTRKVYQAVDVEYAKENYIAGREFGLTTLSNRNNNYNKAIYTSEEIYNIDYDYSAMQREVKVPLYPLEKLAKGIRWVESKLHNVPDGVSAGSLVKYFHEQYTDEELFEGFEDLVTSYMAKDELKDNIIAMIRKFKRNEGGVYESELLTKNIMTHEATNTYCEELQDYIAEKLKNGRGKISDLIEKEIDFRRNSAYERRRIKGKTTTRLNDGGDEIMFMRPQFDSFSDLRNGQRIALNDIWATDVMLTACEIKGEEYTIKYDVTLWDHFGLDKPDLEKWFNIIGRARAIFAAWFTLQHLRGYKPFITKIQFTREFAGKFSEGKDERVRNRG